MTGCLALSPRLLSKLQFRKITEMDSVRFLPQSESMTVRRSRRAGTSKGQTAVSALRDGGPRSETQKNKGKTWRNGKDLGGWQKYNKRLKVKVLSKCKLG